MPKLHVLLRQEELDPTRLEDKVVIVLDILFATSTIVHAFDEGVASVSPALDSEDAIRLGAEGSGAVLAGEYLASGLPDFEAATPLALARTGLRGRRLVYSTTNGTPALHRASTAAHVYVGALLNGGAVVEHVARTHPDAPVLLLCAGSLGRINLEDFYGAGHLARHFSRLDGYHLSDAALAAAMLSRGSDARDALLASRVGQRMQSFGLRDEVEYAATCDRIDIVPQLLGGELRRAAA
ncbi:MAG TPA: 2-phosphosulfolactate phosphatase [Rhodanobacter sp.]|nr:2-phosphosulfolactate phosphatase [Rhodanobacter sp.]